MANSTATLTGIFSSTLTWNNHVLPDGIGTITIPPAIVVTNTDTTTINAASLTINGKMIVAPTGAVNPVINAPLIINSSVATALDMSNANVGNITFGSTVVITLGTNSTRGILCNSSSGGLQTFAGAVTVSGAGTGCIGIDAFSPTFNSTVTSTVSSADTAAVRDDPGGSSTFSGLLSQTNAGWGMSWRSGICYTLGGLHQGAGGGCPVVEVGTIGLRTFVTGGPQTCVDAVLLGSGSDFTGGSLTDLCDLVMLGGITYNRTTDAFNFDNSTYAPASPRWISVFPPFPVIQTCGYGAYQPYTPFTITSAMMSYGAGQNISDSFINEFYHQEIGYALGNGSFIFPPAGSVASGVPYGSNDANHAAKTTPLVGTGFITGGGGSGASQVRSQVKG